MRTLAEDTSPEMEAVLIGLLRKRTPAQKLMSLVGLRDLAKRLIFSDLRSRYPQASERELRHRLNIRRLGREMADKIFFTREGTFNSEASMLNEAQIIALVAKRFDELKIPYYIGGAVASIVHGEERFTKDADIVIRILPVHIKKFVKAFEFDFVVSEDVVQDSLTRRYAFNIIHIDTAYKIDLYPISDEDEMELAAFARRQRRDIGTGEIWLATAEDVILAKLHWFRKGGEVSEKQWRDVLGVLKVQGENLDFAYLEQMAARFGLADLLARAREDAGSV
ncbi:hypothetical protein L0337_41705 [candidate division KSB1 bacterium]|nr:hypothetical protein [candidate division KSB1 bacterium]